MAPTCGPSSGKGDRGLTRSVERCPPLVGNVGLAVAWWAIVHFGAPLAVAPGAIAALWLPSGLGLVAVFRCGVRFLPGVFVGAAAAAFEAGASWGTTTFVTVGCVLEVLAGVRALAIVDRFRSDLTDVRSALSLIVVSAPLMATVGTSVAVLGAGVTGGVPEQDLAAMWGGWWLADVIAVVTLAPLLMTWTAPGGRGRAPGSSLELAGLLAALVTAVFLVFTRTVPSGVAAAPFTFVVVPFLIWAAVRHGPRGAAAASFLASAVATVCTLSGIGPMAVADPRVTLVLLLSFIVVAGASTLVLAGALAATRTMAATLAETEARERALLLGLPDYVYRLTPDGSVLETHGLAASHGAETATARVVEGLLTGSGSRDVRDHMLAAIVRGSLQVVELEDEQAAPGRTFEARFVPVRDGALIAMVRDVSDRRRAEQAVRESEERYRTVFAQNPSPILILDERTQVFVDANEAAVRLYGWSVEELRGMTAREIRPVDEVAPYQALMKSLGDRPYASTRPWVHRRKDGSRIDVEIVSHRVSMDGRPVRIVMVSDVSERLRLEREVREAQKMDAIGRLVGGIAHDFNNLLTSVVGYSELLLDTIPMSDSAHGDVREILTAGRRGTQLTRQLLAFSRQQVLSPRVVDLNHVLRHMEETIGPTLGDRVELAVEPAAGVPRVKADRALLEQVLTNLVTNSREAMTQGGRLTLAVRIEELEPGAVRARADVAPGTYAVLRVTDTGVGMDAETRRRMFEPFFTTKPLGRGAGLGLAAVYGFVTQLGGFVEVDSTPGQGTTVALFLPLLETDLPSGVLVQPGAMPFAGTETILCVEEDPSVCRLVRRALTERGYTVLVASGEAEATGVALHHEGALDLALVALVLRQGSGLDLAVRMRKVRPVLRFLYMTGYTGIDSRAAVVEGQTLVKPFSPTQLARAIRSTLDA